MGNYSKTLSKRIRHPELNLTRYGLLPKESNEVIIKPDKGKYQGSCNRTAYQLPGANYFNFSTRAYYCGSCANDINKFHLREYETLLCYPVDNEEQRQEVEAKGFYESQKKR